MKVALGDTLEVDGEEYVLVSIRTTVDGSGRSVELHARDPFLAQGMQAEIAQRRAVLELAERHLKEEDAS